MLTNIDHMEISMNDVHEKEEPLTLDKTPLITLRRSEWKQALSNHHVIIPQLHRHIGLLEDRVMELEGELKQATDKYTAQFRRVNNTDGSTSPCTLIFAGLLLFSGFFTNWFL